MTPNFEEQAKEIAHHAIVANCGEKGRNWLELELIDALEAAYEQGREDGINEVGAVL